MSSQFHFHFQIDQIVTGISVYKYKVLMKLYTGLKDVGLPMQQFENSYM